jgi:hypothetical protein
MLDLSSDVADGAFYDLIYGRLLHLAVNQAQSNQVPGFPIAATAVVC